MTAVDRARARWPSNRTRFKLHSLDGLTLDRIATAYGVHEATVSRWSSAARQTVLDHATRAIVDQLGAGHADAQSLILLLRSRSDVSVAAALGTGA